MEPSPCMETASLHHHLPRTTPYTLPLINHQPPKQNDARTHLGLDMRLSFRGDLTLKRASGNLAIANNYRFQDPPKPFCVVNTLKQMATKNNESKEPITESMKKKEEDKEPKKLAPPPPPEMPEPGDCCGSGCVRCVWDVYYEELEAYNKFYQSDSSDSKSS